jgi:ribosome-binding factor A
MRNKRIDRVSEEYKRVLIQVIRKNLQHSDTSDMLTVIDVKITRDFRCADVFLSILDTDKKIKRTMEVLEIKKGIIRSEMGRKVKMHYTPEIRFHMDNSAEYAIHISKLLEDIK